MKKLFENYKKDLDPVKVREMSNALLLDSIKEKNVENLKKIMGFIDLTSLNPTDSVNTAGDICEKVNRYSKNFANIPNVAGICVFPSLIPEIDRRLAVKGIDIVSVSAGFPASQTFIDVKIKETIMAVSAGATEIDIVINLGKFLIGDTKAAHKEICKLKESAGNAKLKVILETGLLPDYNAVWQASLLAMDAGADFIKTSTGKFQPAATPDKFYVMAMAIKEFYDKTGHKVGIKPAGGISTIEDALIYFYIVKSVIGNEWLNKSLFRIGASRLSNNLLAGIYELMGGKNSIPAFF